MLNKNISIWRGTQTPPTNYHLWEKEDGSLYIYLDKKWQLLVTPKDKATLDEHKKQLDKIKNLALVEINPTDNNTYKSYQLKSDNNIFGETINIPKDMVVSSGSLKSVISADNPYAGAKVGDKYIDLIIANSTSDHIYIPVSDLISTYLAGDGLTLENLKFSIKKDVASESYLTVSADGVNVSGIDQALEGKVDKEEGKSLVSTTEITKLEKLNLPDTILKESENTVQNKVVKAAIDEINTKLTWAILS